MGSSCSSAKQYEEPQLIIMETDLGNDIDDAIAMDLLYKYQDEGRINILMIGLNKEGTAPAEYADVLNTWYGYPDIPIGIIHDGVDCETDAVNYAKSVNILTDDSGEPLFKRSHPGYQNYPETSKLYRKVLARQKDNSVTIVSVGFSTNLVRLLDTEADEYSDLNGTELVRKKIKQLVVMAGQFDDPNAHEYNVLKDIQSAKVIFEQWPSPVVATGFEVGVSIKYPASSILNDFGWAYPAHPVVEAYKRYQKMPYDRPTWDPTAVLYAVEGGDRFTVSPKGKIEVTEEGSTIFSPDDNGTRRYLAVTPEQADDIRSYFIQRMNIRPLVQQTDIVTDNVRNAEKQLSYLVSMADEGDKVRTPATLKDGKVVYVGPSDWMSGFFAGSLWYMYELTGKEKWAQLAQKHTEILHDVQYLKWHHDVGFMVYDSYGNGLRLKNIPGYDTVIVNTAKSLATRFRPAAGVLQSWDVDKGWMSERGWKCPVIIDNMMNLELLFKASEMTGDSSFRDIAITHANTTLKNHYRDDFSTWHVLDYDDQTGEIRRKCTAQGVDDNSRWARGQAWSLYGFTVAYRCTGDKRYLQRAKDVANYLLVKEDNMPEDLVPLWDFDVKEFSATKDDPDYLQKYGHLRDASSAAIISSALYELYGITEDKLYKNSADKIVQSLSSSAYRATPGTNGGFLLLHCVGSIPHGSQIDVPLSYADYYFLEALVRKSRIENGLIITSCSQKQVPDYACLTSVNHPRLFADADEFKKLKSKIERNENPVLVKMHNDCMMLADSIVQASTCLQYKVDVSGKRILHVSRDAIKRIFFNAYAYRFTNEDKYLRQAEMDINSVCDFPDWNPSHFLDDAEMACAVGIGYDWLYPSLQDSTKRKASEAIQKFAFKPAADDRYNKWQQWHSNWNQVCNGGLTVAALAFYEDCPQLAKEIIDMAVTTNKPCQQAIYPPVGAYSEGPVYWIYGNMYESLLLSAMESTLGTDFGLGDVPGFDNTAYFYNALIGNSGQYFNYSDNLPRRMPAYPLWYFADRFKDPSMIYSEAAFILKEPYRELEEETPERLMPLYIIHASHIPLDKVVPPKNRIIVSDGKSPIVMARTGWESNDLYLGVKGGRPSNSHGHMDPGSFVYDAYGVRWAADLQRQEYVEIENYCKELGGDLWDFSQKSVRWKLFRYNNYQHNTLTVNDKLMNVNACANMLESYDTPDRYGAAFDLTELYWGDLTSAVREVSIRDREYLEIIDNLEGGLSDAKVRFTLVTQSDAHVAEDGIRLSANGVDLMLHVSGHDVEYKIWSSDPKDYGMESSYFDAPVDEVICGFEMTLAAGQKVSLVTTLKKE